MPEVMRQFGQTIIVAVAGGLLITLLFVAWPGGGSVLDEIGSRASSGLDERSVTGTGTDGFDQHSSRALPVAAVNGSAERGVQFTLVDKFTIANADGAFWSQADRGFILDGNNLGGQVQIESITSIDGTEHVGGLTGDYTTSKVELSQATGTARFLESGVYRVRLKVMDHDNVGATYTIPFVVDFALTNDEEEG